MKLMGIEKRFLNAEVREAWNAIGIEASDPGIAFHPGTIEKCLIDVAEIVARSQRAGCPLNT